MLFMLHISKLGNLNFHTFSHIYRGVKLVLSGHSKIDKTKVLKKNGSLMKAESIADLQYF